MASAAASRESVRSSEAELTIVNVLPIEFDARNSVERAVRWGLRHLPGGPWTITIKKQVFDPERFSVQASAHGKVLCTSFGGDASDDEIASGLSIFARLSS